MLRYIIPVASGGCAIAAILIITVVIRAILKRLVRLTAGLNEKHYVALAVLAGGVDSSWMLLLCLELRRPSRCRCTRI